jgi:cytochrome c biogenesis factor
MNPELGHYALMLALGPALIQGIMPIVGTRTSDPMLMSIAAPAALAQFVFVAIAFWRSPNATSPPTFRCSMSTRIPIPRCR